MKTENELIKEIKDLLLDDAIDWNKLIPVFEQYQKIKDNKSGIY